MKNNEIPKPELPIYREIERIVTPIFNKVLQEINKNPMWVGKEKSDRPSFIYIQPHNYRRYFDFNKNNLTLPNPPKKDKTRVLKDKTEYSIKNHSSEHHFNNFFNCRIIIRKKTIEIINKIEHKRWYSIDMYRGKEQVSAIILKKETECVGVLEAFFKRFGGHSEFNLIKSKEEVKVENSPITDKINKRLTWHTKDHKKVYQKKQVEVYDIVKAVQLIDNSIYYDNNEEIARPMRVLAEGIKELLPKGFNYLKKNIKTKQDIRYYQEFFKDLNEEETFGMMKHLKQILYVR